MRRADPPPLQLRLPAVEPAPPAATLSGGELRTLLDVTRALAAPFELNDMLSTVAAAACQVLHAERASVWLLDHDGRHLRLEVASDLGAVRVPVGEGLVGWCAAERRTLNVADCYGDPRFNPAMDRRSGFVTRCLLALPLVDEQGALVGVLQVLNGRAGAFGAGDEALAEALAAQCAVALSRVRLSEAVRAAELLQREIELASELQRATLPLRDPAVPGYALHGSFRPASQTGGDTWDAAPTSAGLLVLLADAVGHGLPAALSVVQMHAMLRLALEVTPELAVAYRIVNDRLASAWTDGRFVTAFVGLLDPVNHRLRFVSGGQGPILHWRAAERCFAVRPATVFPMGAMPLAAPPRTAEIVFEPGDWLVLLSDGYYEFENEAGEPFGRARVEALFAEGPGDGPVALTARLLDAVLRHAGRAPQADDMTSVLLQRLPAHPLS